MFAIAFDLVVEDALTHHPRGVTAAYVDIRRTLTKYGFIRAFRVEQWSDFTSFMKD